MKIASFLTVSFLALSSIHILSAQLPIGHITQKQRDEFARRFERFADTTKQDSAQCCLLDFARILASPTTNPLIVSELIKLSKVKHITAIINAFLPYFNELPEPMKHAILELKSRGKLNELLIKRVANNDKVACSQYPPGYKNT